MPYTLKIFTPEEVTDVERDMAATRFREALEESLGDASLVLPVYRAYLKLVQTWGDAARPWSLSEGEQLLLEQWEAAELAATQAAFGVNRYMEDAQFEIGASMPLGPA